VVSSRELILGHSGAHWHSNESRLLSGDLAVHIGTAVRSLGYNSKGFRYNWTSSEEPGLKYGASSAHWHISMDFG